MCCRLVEQDVGAAERRPDVAEADPEKASKVCPFPTFQFIYEACGAELTGFRSTWTYLAVWLLSLVKKVSP